MVLTACICGESLELLTESFSAFFAHTATATPAHPVVWANGWFTTLLQASHAAGADYCSPIHLASHNSFFDHSCPRLPSVNAGRFFFFLRRPSSTLIYPLVAHLRYMPRRRKGVRNGVFDKNAYLF
jgi:hypothetical protein